MHTQRTEAIRMFLYLSPPLVSYIKLAGAVVAVKSTAQLLPSFPYFIPPFLWVTCRINPTGQNVVNLSAALA